MNWQEWRKSTNIEDVRGGMSDDTLARIIQYNEENGGVSDTDRRIAWWGRVAVPPDIPIEQLRKSMEEYEAALKRVNALRKKR